MPHPRRRPDIAPAGRITVRLSTAQRDLFLTSSGFPRALGHALHRAPVRDGKLSLRVKRDELQAMIDAAARERPQDRRADRALETLLRYLESLDDRFAEPNEAETEDAAAGQESRGI